MDRRTAVVSGALAFKMRRTRAAQAGELGQEVLTLPQLAARLAGGFQQEAKAEVLQPAVRSALQDGGFQDLESVRDLPGMTRAVLRTLSAVWRADLRLIDRSEGSARLADLALLEDRVRRALPSAYLLPQDLRDRALARIEHAPSLFGHIRLQGVLDVEPIWRPLVSALAATQAVTWEVDSDDLDRGWFAGALQVATRAAPAEARAEICADPRAEVVEALRWARALLSSGQVQASDVAITSVVTETWDEHMLALSREAGLPVHFSHGLPALDTLEGQACAALADILLRGLSQPRLRRLLRRVQPVGLPDDWSRGIRRAAGLFTVAHWLRALADARPRRASDADAESVLAPILELLARGVSAASEAGELLLTGSALNLWREALRGAPAEALELSLGSLRLPDPSPPGACVTWGPAAHLAAVPRGYVRLLGLTGRSWPRPVSEDPLLPDHILSRREIEPVARPEMDRLLFRAIAGAACGELVLSRARRSAEGQLQPASPLWSARDVQTLARTRVPGHAFSETDRLLARPEEAAAQARLALSRLCWRNWSSNELTMHDGLLSTDAPLVIRALGGSHSTTSLRRLLRDPLAYVWRHVLGWRPVESGVRPLALDARTFGELVHELLRRAVDHLEPEPGLARANTDEMEAATSAAAAAVAEAWPLERAIPPPLLWRRTLESATALALRGLTFDESFQAGTRSWTELPFGEPSALIEETPWTTAEIVTLGGLALDGRIDRLDLRATGDAVRVTDYKTGAAPRHMERIVLGRGTELQRVVYAAAARQLLPAARHVVSRLVYLSAEPVQHALTDDTLNAAIDQVAAHITAAASSLRSGAAPPGPDADARFNAMRLALPADLDLYLRRKSTAISAASGPLADLWSTQ